MEDSVPSQRVKRDHVFLITVVEDVPSLSLISPLLLPS
jgi:hypothetical protein